MRIAQSSHIYAHHYDPEDRSLTIQFVNGALYHYANVPQTEYDNLTQSASPGGYFHAKIKPQYKTTKLADGLTPRRQR